jgi:hypothetical protein
VRACRADRCRAPQDEDDKPDEPGATAKPEPEQKPEPEPETESKPEIKTEGSDDHAPVKTVSIAVQTDPEDPDELTAHKFTEDMMDRVEAATARAEAAEAQVAELESKMAQQKETITDVMLAGTDEVGWYLEDFRKIMFEALPYEDCDEFWDWLREQGLDPDYLYFTYQVLDFEYRDEFCFNNYLKLWMSTGEEVHADIDQEWWEELRPPTHLITA